MLHIWKHLGFAQTFATIIYKQGDLVVSSLGHGLQKTRGLHNDL